MTSQTIVKYVSKIVDLRNSRSRKLSDDKYQHTLYTGLLLCPVKRCFVLFPGCIRDVESCDNEKTVSIRAVFADVLLLELIKYRCRNQFYQSMAFNRDVLTKRE